MTDYEKKRDVAAAEYAAKHCRRGWEFDTESDIDEAYQKGYDAGFAEALSSPEITQALEILLCEGHEYAHEKLARLVNQNDHD